MGLYTVLLLCTQETQSKFLLERMSTAAAGGRVVVDIEQRKWVKLSVWSCCQGEPVVAWRIRQRHNDSLCSNVTDDGSHCTFNQSLELWDIIFHFHVLVQWLTQYIAIHTDSQLIYVACQVKEVSILTHINGTTNKNTHFRFHWNCTCMMLKVHDAESWPGEVLTLLPHIPNAYW